MLKSFLGKSRRAAVSEEPTIESAFRTSASIERLKALLEFFPIGKKLRYIPEFKKEIVFDTIVVAYCVNGEFIYSGESIERDAQGMPVAFRAGEEGDQLRVPVAGIKQFQMLVPDTSDLEMGLDYHRRALIGRGRQFNKGNYISLISNSGFKGLSTIDTEVAKQVELKDGPYAHRKMVLLTPEMHTLEVTDQRGKNRTKTCAPVMVSLSEGRLSGPCTIVDVSDEAVRIRVRDGGAPLPAMSKGDPVMLDIALGEAERHFSLKGEVIRRSPETCVIRLLGMVKDGKTSSFGPLDLLELKSGLLNYTK